MIASTGINKGKKRKKKTEKEGKKNFVNEDFLMEYVLEMPKFNLVRVGKRSASSMTTMATKMRSKSIWRNFHRERRKRTNEGTNEKIRKEENGRGRERKRKRKGINEGRKRKGERDRQSEREEGRVGFLKLERRGREGDGSL